jgi:hypothetical protein
MINDAVAAFSKLGEDDGYVRLMKVGYGALNLVNLGLALYKCNTIGLFPTTPSDWLEFMHAPQVCIMIMEINTTITSTIL